MSGYIKREDATAVISKTLGSLGNSVVTEINSLPGYATQDNARITQESTQDLISREAAREAIEKLMDIHFDRQVVLAKARDAIVSLPSAEPKTGWIPVSEKLPSDGGNYLITVADLRLGHNGEHTVTMADFYPKAKKWNSIVDVYAWMPLPEPYKGGEEE